jgi:hypothetical protein
MITSSPTTATRRPGSPGAEGSAVSGTVDSRTPDRPGLRSVTAAEECGQLCRASG